MSPMFGILIGSRNINKILLKDTKEDVGVTQSTKEILSRNEVPEEFTWRLEDIFATDDEWNEEYNDLQESIPQIGNYRGKSAESSKTLYALLSLQDELSERLGKLFTYARMRNDEDTTNSFYQAMNAKAQNVLTLATSHMSFIIPEILTIEEQTLERFIEENDDLKLYQHTLNEIN